MSATSHDRRVGMTLIELLVVIAILGLLAVTVVPNIANTSDRRKVREAARAVSSFIAAGQSRALGSRGGGGVWIDPLSNTITSGTLSISVAIDLAEANIGTPYAGDSTASKVVFSTPSSGTTANVSFVGGCNPPSATNNLIRLGSSPTWFGFTSTSGSTGTIWMRSAANQTVANTFWPASGVSLTYEIVAPPARSTGNALTLGDGVAIDLYHSWCGTNLTSLLVTATTPFQIIYDSTGTPQCLSCNGNAATLNEPLFLLVAPIASIQTSGTLAPTDGYWVAIDPRGGIPKVAEVDPSGTTIVAQQSYIRSGAVQYSR